MNRIDEERGSTATTKVFPALIHIPDAQGFVPGEPGKRRITALLDHPIARQLAVSSWLLAVLAVAVRRPVTAILVSAAVGAGLIIGVINAVRWLFRKG
ncbi:MAG: hypothetical protein JOZ62_10255 [Acidobacteriaceae bacterium]|nr:hypothetical protein [Acidobacteriaceae bacterium]